MLKLGLAARPSLDSAVIEFVSKGEEIPHLYPSPPDFNSEEWTETLHKLRALSHNWTFQMCDDV